MIKLMNKQNKVVAVEAVSKEDGRFLIHWVDVRMGEDARRKVNSIIKNSNATKGSLFIKKSFSLFGRAYN